MLTLITGGAMSHKDAALRDRIVAAVSAGKNVLVIVPDQFSYEYDKLLYDIFGAKLFNRISVMGINRLAEQIRKQTGSENGSFADENTKTILMFKAIKLAKAEKKIIYFQRSLDKPSFVTEMLETVREFRKNEITSAELAKASEMLDGAVSEKLYDLSVIFDIYDKLLSERGLCDDLSVISEAASSAMESGYFNGWEIFIDRFDTFSADEYSFLEVVLHQCENMAVALTLSDENNSRSHMSPFAAVGKTASSLESMAASVGIPCDRVRTAQYYYNKSSLVHINANIFCVENHPSPNTQGVEVVYAQDCYDEVDYCAAEIKRLVREEKMKYSDIAVITRQLSDYEPVIESAFEKYEIPAFIDTKHSVSKSALAIYLSSILDCLKGKNFKTERILKMIKSPLSPFKDFEISAIEEYCYCWDVDGDMWKSPFTASQGKNDNLDTVNRVRERIVSPIAEFRENSLDCTARTLVRNFSKVLEEYKLTQCANSIAKLSLSVESKKSYVTEKTDSLELAREFKQMWEMFLEGLHSVYDVVGEEKISLHEFTEVFGLLLSGMTVANPPQRTDTVTVASAEHSRLSAVKAVFVLGANGDKFPAYGQKIGFFSEREKKLLHENNVKIYETALDIIYRERLTAYLALTQGSDRLYVCCPKTDFKGKSLTPSIIVKELIRMFGNGIAVDASSKGADFYCCTSSAAFSRFSECMNDRTVESETLRRALEAVPDYKDRVKSLVRNSEYSSYALSEEFAQKLFFTDGGSKKSIYISPSSVDKYAKCPFGYFCEYGLRLRPPVKKGINSINRGNIVHYILENIMSRQENGVRVYDEKFETLTELEIKAKVIEYSEDYKEQELGGDFGKTPRFYAVFERLRENAVLVIKNIQQELLQSRFKPCAFELSIKSEDGKPYLTIENSDMVINVRGTIDRLDTFEEDGKKYVKIVDYKTGSVKNLLMNIFHGASLQLVIYLTALLEYENSDDPGVCLPGGIVYTPAVYINSSTSAKEDKDVSGLEGSELLEVTAKFNEDYVKRKLARYGIVCNDTKILSALNEEQNKQFIPSGQNGTAVEREKLEAIGEHARSMIERAGTGLYNGRIPADPLGDVTGSSLKKPCTYCSYSPICGAKNLRPKNLVTSDDAERLDRILEGLISVKNERK